MMQSRKTLVLSVAVVGVFLTAVAGCARPRGNPIEVTEHEVLVTDDNFEAEVMQATTPVLLDFSAEWCGPCQIMAPVVQEIAEEYEGRLKVGIVDTDRKDTEKISTTFQVGGIPAFFVVVDGEIVAATKGADSASSFRSWLDTAIAKAE